MGKAKVLQFSTLKLIKKFLEAFFLIRYNEMLFIVDTCQAASLYQKFYSPNIIAIGSSLVGEDSLSHHVDPAIGVYISDRYTYYALEFLEHVTLTSNHTLGQFVRFCRHYYSNSETHSKHVSIFS